MKFIHAADIHLDSPLRGLAKYEGAPVEEMRAATRRALENLVDLALERAVDFVLIAGDLYDGDWQDHNTGLFFVGQMRRLREADVPVVMIRGNHDAESKMTRSLRLPENVESLSPRRAETAKSPRLAELGVAVHGRSYAQPAETNNLAAEYPQAVGGCFNIGLLHTSLDGREGHHSYAPCTLDDLRSKEYDYWALGHIHQREQVATDPHIHFPGNIQGRHIREPGAKGCLLVEVDANQSIDVQFEPLDVFRWYECAVDVGGIDEPDQVVDRFQARLDTHRSAARGRPLALRVIVTGCCRAHERLAADLNHWTNEIRSAALDRAAGRVWIEQIRFLTSPERDWHDLIDGDGPIGMLVEYLHQLQESPEQLAALGAEFGDLRKRLPPELIEDTYQGVETLRFDNPDWVRQIVAETEPLLISRLLSRQEAAS